MLTLKNSDSLWGRWRVLPQRFFTVHQLGPHPAPSPHPIPFTEKLSRPPPRWKSAYAYAYMWVNTTASLTTGTKTPPGLSTSCLHCLEYFQPDSGQRTADSGHWTVAGRTGKQKQEAWLPQICTTGQGLTLGGCKFWAWMCRY